MSEIAVIGTGGIGSRLCGHLARAGHHVVAFDRSDAALAAAVAKGGSPALSAREAAAGAEYCFLALRDEDDVAEVLIGEEGVAEVLRPSSVLIDTTSSHPAVTREMGAAVASKGCFMLDAPVSGSIEAADEGRLSLMVGGDVAVLDRCRPVLETFATDILHAGALGCGHAAQALNALLFGVALVATGEAMEMGTHFGIAAEAILDAVNASSGESYASSLCRAQASQPGGRSSGLTLGQMAREIRIGIDAAGRVGVPTPTFDRLWSLYRLMLQTLDPAADNMNIIRYSTVLGRER